MLRRVDSLDRYPTSTDLAVFTIFASNYLAHKACVAAARRASTNQGPR